jgi:hypothetical protein
MSLLLGLLAAYVGRVVPRMAAVCVIDQPEIGGTALGALIRYLSLDADQDVEA